MTTAQLEKIGVKVVSARNPRILNIPCVGEVYMVGGETYADLFEAVYEHGRNEGIVFGQKLKADEIKACLNIES